MLLHIGFGKTQLPLEVPDENLLGVLRPNDIRSERTGEDAVRHALQNPIGTKRLGEIVRPGEKIAIVTSDLTRPLPSHRILPILLDELEAGGVSMDDVTVVFALGSHRRQTADEMRRLVGEAVISRVRCVDGDPDDCVRLGETTRGTPVDITRVVALAKIRICVGNVEYHYFAGYSGGAKAIMPGVSTRSAIQNNHRMMLDPNARAGVLAGNPVREDLEEAIAHCPIDFIVNVVLDEKKEIVHAACGHFIEAHRDACAFLDRMYKKKIDTRADIVIASQGGAPKDINLYQTQKALDNARHAVRDGGVVILVGACDEGLGEHTFESWLLEAEKPSDLTARIAREFRLGGHKAAAIAQVLERAEIYLVSNMQPDFVERLFMKPFADIQGALDAALAQRGPSATVLVMPQAGSTLPVV